MIASTFRFDLTLTNIQPLAARDQVATYLSRSRDAIFAGNFKEAWSNVQPICSQLWKSNYVRFVILAGGMLTPKLTTRPRRSSCSTSASL